LLDTAEIPGSREQLRLYRHDRDFSIRAAQGELMNSREHHSEDALAQLACKVIEGRKQARVLVGGLGMGFTLAAALPLLARDARVVVAELIPDVVRWNRGELGALTGHALNDPRVEVIVGNVGALMERERNGFDAILLDVDNGPEGFTRRGNDALYDRRGLSIAHAALRRGGVLTVWSAKPSRPFRERLDKQGFHVEEVRVRSRGRGKGAFHTVWVATRDSRGSRSSRA
jgi:spermidine synthase